MLDAPFLRSTFAAALPYEAYVETASPAHLPRWRDMESRIALTDAQQQLLRAFVRPVNILVSSGTWCGDCVAQCPMFRAFEKANPALIALRLVDRDEHKDLADRVMISEGNRVPVFIFMNEDFDFISLMGDRSLTRYRAIAARQLGASCPVPGAPIPADELARTIQDWLDELERVHLLCRLSPKLRAKHAD
ncbi:MAG: thioredoxin family protein [Phycisphaerales bacterium]|nr:thioredoxin family protein [Phycisphaerales bacterium]MCB9841505.1 thioredoxin family protein [Phycisphaeraceae bacterium]